MQFPQPKANNSSVSFIEINPNPQHRDEYENEVKTASYVLHEKVEVSRDLFVSRVGMAKTCLLRIEPSKMVRYRLNPMERETEAVERFHFHQMDRSVIRISKFIRSTIMALIREKLKLFTKLCKCKSTSFGNKLHKNSIYTRNEKPKLNPHKRRVWFPKMTDKAFLGCF